MGKKKSKVVVSDDENQSDEELQKEIAALNSLKRDKRKQAIATAKIAEAEEEPDTEEDEDEEEDDIENGAMDTDESEDASEGDDEEMDITKQPPPGVNGAPANRASIIAYRTATLQKRYEEISITEGANELPFIEHLAVMSSQPIMVADVEDEFERENAIQAQAREAVAIAKQKIVEAGVKFDRPEDFYAEMIKSDQHMLKIRQNLLDQQTRIKRSEEVAKIRKQKKFGKKVQEEKLQEKIKKSDEKAEKLKLIKKTSQNVDDEFGITIDDAESSKRGKAGKPGDKPKPNLKRQHKNEKYGFGGPKKRAKSNTADSTADFNFSSKKMKEGLQSKKQKAKPKQRPGKSKRRKMGK